MKNKKKIPKIYLIGASNFFLKTQKAASPTIMFKSSKYLYFKHFILLNYLWYTKKKIGINLYLYLFLSLHFKYFKLNNNKINLLLNNSFTYSPILNLGLKSRFLIKKNFSKNFFNYQMFYFIQWWKILEYFYIPKKFRFNRNFLLNKKCINNLIDLYTFVHIQINKFFSFLNIIFNKIFLVKINLSAIFISKILLNSFETLKFDKNLLDFNLSSFLKSNWNLWKYYYSYLWVLPNKYDSFWAFLNVSLFLTWSFLFQFNISPSGFDIWNLLLFNYIFFWYGDNPRTYGIEYYTTWGWWNFIYWLGSPYTSLKFGDFKDNFLLNFNTTKKENLKMKYYSYDHSTFFFWKSLYQVVLFNNYIYANKYIPDDKFLNPFRTKK